MLLVSDFHLGQPIDGDVLCSFRTISIFPDCFPLLAVRTANGCYRFILSQDVFPFFPDYFSPFQTRSCCCSSLFCSYRWYLWMSPLSRYPAALQKCQLCSSQGCFWFTGLVSRLTVPRLAGISSVSIFLADIFFR